MIISDEKTFIFVHNYKVAGSSVKDALQPHATPSKSASSWRAFLDRQLVRIGLKGEPSYPDPHMQAVEIQEAFPEEWSEYFTFAFVRNPWAWQVSLYFYMKQEPKHFQHELVQSLEGFDEYIEWRVQEDKRLQSDNLCDDEENLLVDYVGRLETIREDFGAICDILNLNASLPHRNRSSHRDYREYYTDQTRSLVAEHFQEDIERFGYGFDGIGEPAPIVEPTPIVT
jgi:hypothetical protein